jgi:hypothetical protein
MSPESIGLKPPLAIELPEPLFIKRILLPKINGVLRKKKST